MTTPAQLRLLHHTLGVTPDQREPYRNHLVAAEGHHDWDDLLALESEGLMYRFDTPGFCRSDDIVFRCTGAGKAYAIEHLPEPPKRTRYEEFLRADDACGSTFAEFLGIEEPEYEYCRDGYRMVRRRMVDYRFETVAGEWMPTKKEAKASYKEALRASKEAA